LEPQKAFLKVLKIFVFSRNALEKPFVAPLGFRKVVCHSNEALEKSLNAPSERLRENWKFLTSYIEITKTFSLILSQK
jgi:hypothetical protein